MDHRQDTREFLASRRAKINPKQAGLPVHGAGHRRVPGLRREEVALLAGVSVDYYTRLERGHLGGVSDSVLEALARALQLDEAEREHLFDLAHAANATSSTRRRRIARGIRPSVQRVLDAMIGAPAVIRNGRLDYLTANTLGRALYAPLFESPARPPNSARFTFLDPGAPQFYADWNRVATDLVAILRAEAGRHPYDKGLTDLIGELSTRSDEFRTRWADHDVRPHHTGSKKLHHPVVGDIELFYEVMDLTADPDLTMHIYTPEPDTPSADALKLLASWAETHQRAVNAGSLEAPEQE